MSEHRLLLPEGYETKLDLQETQFAIKAAKDSFERALGAYLDLLRVSAPLFVRPESGLNRNKVTRYIEEHNVQTRLLFSGNLVKHPCFDQIRGTDAYRVVGDLTTTDFIMNNTFWVGVYPGMTDEMIDYMAGVIIEAVNQQ